MNCDILMEALNNPLRQKYHLNVLFGDINKNPNDRGFTQWCDPEKHQTDDDIEKLFDRHKDSYKNYGFATGHEGLADFDFDWLWVYLRAKEHFGDRLDTYTLKTPNGGVRVLNFTDFVKGPEKYKKLLLTEIHFKKYVACYGEAKKDDGNIGKYELIQNAEIRKDETIAKDMMEFFPKLLERYKFLTYPCIKTRLPNKKNHLTHEQRLAISNFLIHAEIPIPESAEFFSICPDYDKAYSEYQVSDTSQRIKEGKLNYPTCETLRSDFSWDEKDCKGCLRKKEKTESSGNDLKNASKNEKQGNFTIAQVMELQNWGYNGRIVAPVCFDKEIEGKRTFIQFIVYWEDEKIKEQRIASTMFIPPTGPTPKILEMLKSNLKIQDIYESFYKEFDKHVYFTDKIQYKLAVLGAMSTYFREVFNSYPYFDFFSAIPDVGKTQAMQCLIWLCYCGFNTVNPTESVLFRAVDESHAAVGIDEVGKLFRDPKQNREILSLLLTGYKKGLPAYRTNMDVKPPRPVAYDSFGLKAFTRKEPIPRDLESRSITFHMMANNYRKVIEQHITPNEFSDHRDMMYCYRLRHSDDVKKAYAELQKERILDGRIAELYLPLLSIAKLISEELYQEIFNHAKGDEARKSDIKNDGSFIELVKFLWDGNYADDVKVVEIRDKLREVFILQGEEEKEVKKWLSSQWIISKLNAMGFQRSLKQSQNRSHYSITMTRLKLWYDDIFGNIHSKQTSPNLTNDNSRHDFSQNKPNLKEEEVRFDNEEKLGEASLKLGSIRFDSYSKVESGQTDLTDLCEYCMKPLEDGSDIEQGPAGKGMVHVACKKSKVKREILNTIISWYPDNEPSDYDGLASTLHNDAWKQGVIIPQDEARIAVINAFRERGGR